MLPASSLAQPDSTVPPPENGPELGDDFVFLPNRGEEDWITLLTYTDTQSFHAEDIIINEGETDRGIYFIVEGQLEVLNFDYEEQIWQQIATLEVGSVFGEQAFFDGRPRSAAVRATSEVTLLRLSPEGFDMLWSREPQLARDTLFDLARILSLRLRQANTANFRK